MLNPLFGLIIFFSINSHELTIAYAKHAPVDSLGSPIDYGIGSRYGDPGDIWAEEALACAPQVHINNHMHVCAHRRLPCGTLLSIETVRTHKRSWCVVMDRGPYGALDESGVWFVKRNESDPGKWRGILDMTPAVATDMHHNGFEPIRVWIIHPVMRPERRGRARRVFNFM